MKIIRAWDYGKNTIRVLSLNEATNNLNVTNIPYKWYFFVTRRDYLRERGVFEKQKLAGIISDIIPEEFYVRVYVDNEHATESLNKLNEIDWNYRNWKIKKLLEVLSSFNIQTFEADIPLWRRWMIDEGIEIESNYKVASIDIETDDSYFNSSITPGEFRIISAAFVDFQTEKRYFICLEKEDDDAERLLLIKICKLMMTFTCICAWNGDKFDFPYLKERMKKHKIEFDWRRIICQDHLYIFKKIGPALASYSLEEVSQKFLGEGKLQHAEKIIEMYRTNKAKLGVYNIQDCWLMYLLEKKSSVTELLATAREINIVGHCFADDVYISRKIDMLVLKKAFELKYFHFKTRVRRPRDDDGDAADYEGAYVFKPELGFHRNVVVFDFSSLYPSIIKTLNASPDTLLESPEERLQIPHTISACGIAFRKDRIGILSSVVSVTAERRAYFKKLMKNLPIDSDEYKSADKMQYVFKYFGLSFYGVIGMKGSRFYDKRIAESITLTGQMMTKAMSAYFTKIHCNTLYGDTDSIFVGNLIRSLINRVVQNLNLLCNRIAKEKLNSDLNFIEMAYDKDFETLILVNKKRYAGMLYSLEGRVFDTPQFYAAGIEYKRTDTCAFVRDLQKTLLINLLTDREASLPEIKNLVYSAKMKCIQFKLTLDEIVFAQKLTKEIEEYQSELLHLKIAKQMLAEGKEVWVGDKVKYFILQTNAGKPVPKQVCEFVGKYDAIYYWNKKIFPAIQRILAVVFKEEDWDRYGLIQVPTRVNKNAAIGRSFLAWDV